jgi:hypothetical protein
LLHGNPSFKKLASRDSEFNENSSASKTRSAKKKKKRKKKLEIGAIAGLFTVGGFYGCAIRLDGEQKVQKSKLFSQK